MSQLDLKPIAEEIDRFESAGKRSQSVGRSCVGLRQARSQARRHGQPRNDAGRAQLAQSRRNPGRPWFKHILYGARYTYAHLELPGLTEAVEAGNWDTARQQAAILQRALSNNINLLEQLNSSLGVGKTSLSSLQSELENIRKALPRRDVHLHEEPASGEEIALDSDTVYETFSVIKLAIASELMHQVQSGKLSLSDRIPLSAGNERLPSGVLYAMDPGLTPTLRDLLTLMIIISDNEATDALGDKVGRANVTAYMHSLGLEKTSIQFSDLDWDRTWLEHARPFLSECHGRSNRQLSF